jgi:hypothetical protein
MGGRGRVALNLSAPICPALGTKVIKFGGGSGLGGKSSCPVRVDWRKSGPRSEALSCRYRLLVLRGWCTKCLGGKFEMNRTFGQRCGSTGIGQTFHCRYGPTGTCVCIDHCRKVGSKQKDVVLKVKKGRGVSLPVVSVVCNRRKV